MARTRSAAVAVLAALVTLAGCGAELGIPSATAEAPTSTGGLRFDPPIRVPTAALVRAVAAADLDNDGRDELVLAAKDGASPTILRRADGRFVAAALPGALGSPVAADIDRDGALDLAGVTPEGVVLHRGQGGGGFAAPVSHAAGDPTQAAVADFDSDGDVDVATLSDDWVVSLLRGDGRGGLDRPTRNAPSANPRMIAPIDLDGDDAADLLVQGSFTVYTMRNDGAGNLGTPERIGRAAYDPTFLAVADLDGDGRSDLISTGPEGIDVRLTDGRGGFGSPRTFAVPSAEDRVEGMTVGDVTGDGTPDLVVARSSPHRLIVAPGDGAGFFKAGVPITLDETPSVVAIADVDGDCARDLVVAGYYRAQVTVLRNATAATCPKPAPVVVIPGGFPPAPGPATEAAKGWGFEASTRVAGARDVRVVDVDGDGRLDLATIEGSANRIAVRLADGTGQFGPTRHVDVPALTRPKTCEERYPVRRTPDGRGVVVSDCRVIADQPTGLATADFDSDGRLDLVTGTLDGETVAVLRATREGYESHRRYAVPDPVTDVSTADLDSDGNEDVLAATGNRVFLLRGDGRGGLGSASLLRGVNSTPAVGDFDRDGDLDLVGARSNGRGTADLVVLLNDGGGSFGSHKLRTVPMGRWEVRRALVVGDATGDGVLDVLFAPESRNAAWLLVGDGRGGFAAPAFYGRGGGPSGPALGDVTGDGRPDLVVANRWTDELAVFPGLVDGGFDDPVHLPVGARPSGVRLDDIDGDRLLDAIVQHEVDGGVTVLHGVRR